MPNALSAYFHHVQSRFMERHGILLDREFHDEIVGLIQSGRGMRTQRVTNSRIAWTVNTSKGKFRVLYSNRHHCLVTVYPSWKSELHREDGTEHKDISGRSRVAVKARKWRARIRQEEEWLQEVR